MNRHRLGAALLLPCFFLLFALPSPAQKINVNQGTFVISNEANGFLITKLINAGHGGDSLYQATVFLAGMPGASAILTPEFLNALASCPSTSEIFTTTVAQVTAQGISVSISTDGSARYDDIEGRPFVQAFSSPEIQTGNGTVQNVLIVHSVTGQAPLNAHVVSGPLAGMTTTYNAFAVAWSDSPSTAAVGAPALSTWGMLLLAGLLAGMAALQLYRATRASESER